MELFAEAGIFAYVAAIIFIVTLVLSVRRPARALQRASLGAVLVMTIGLIGSSLGQRLVARAVSQETVLENKVMMLNIGTRETSANLMLAGLFSLALLGVAGGLSAARVRPED